MDVSLKGRSNWFATSDLTCYHWDMITLAMLLAAPALETGSLKAMQVATFQVCGRRQESEEGPVLRDAAGNITVPAHDLASAEKMRAQPAKNDAMYCVSYERQMTLPKVVSIADMPVYRD